MKYTVVESTRLRVQDLNNEVYDRFLHESKEFLVAEMGLGPYVGFGISNLHGNLTIAIG